MRLAALGLVIDRVAITKIETGQRCVFDYELKNFVLALGKPAGWFLGIESSKNAATKARGKNPHGNKE